MQNGPFEMLWREYQAKYHPRATLPELIELKRAFYTGAIGVLRLIDESVSAGDEDTPEDIQFYNDLDAELVEYQQGVGVTYERKVVLNG